MKTGQGRFPASVGRRSLANRVAKARVSRLAAVALLAAAAFLMLSLLATPALAAKRVALVIGNGAYEHVPDLPNPPNDAEDVGEALGRLGFQVTRVDNAGREELLDSLYKFRRAADVSEIAAVFFAGHGMEVDGHNYLVPVDARLRSDRDVDFEAVKMDYVTQAVDGAGVLSMIILDACRNNPFVNQMQQGKVTRAIGRGLARVEPAAQTLVAFAAGEGQTADDGHDRNSPYTAALLEYIENPDLEVRLLFGKVKDEVVAATGGNQVPHTYASLGGDEVYLNVSVVVNPEKPEPQEPDIVEPPTDGLDRERVAAEAYKWATTINTVEAYELVRKRFPGTFYAMLSEQNIEKLQESGPQAPEPEDGDGQQHASLPPEDPEPSGPTPREIEADLGLVPDEKRHIQQALASLDFDPGPADGVFGKRTRDALAEWHRSQRRPESRYLDEDAARTLLAVHASLKTEEPEPPSADPEPIVVVPPTTVTLETVPADARIRVITPSGSSYREEMVVEPGRYQVVVNARDHEEFRQVLSFEGPTKYRIALCSMKPRNQRVCENRSEPRTRFVQKPHDQRLSGRATRSTESIFGGGISVDLLGRENVKRLVRQTCEKTKEDVKQNIEERCRRVGGRGVSRSTFITTLEECDYRDHRRITRIEGTMVCRGVMGRVQETYYETRQECRNETKMVRVCPDRLVTKLR